MDCGCSHSSLSLSNRDPLFPQYSPILGVLLAPLSFGQTDMMVLGWDCLPQGPHGLTTKNSSRTEEGTGFF